MFKVNNRNTRTSCELCSKLTILTPERSYSGVFIVDFEHIQYLDLLFLLLTLSRSMLAGKRLSPNSRCRGVTRIPPKYLSWRALQQLEICVCVCVCGGGGDGRVMATPLDWWIENLGTHWPTYKKQKYVMRSFPIRILPVKKMVSKKWKMIMSCRVLTQTSK